MELRFSAHRALTSSPLQWRLHLTIARLASLELKSSFACWRNRRRESVTMQHVFSKSTKALTLWLRIAWIIQLCRSFPPVKALVVPGSQAASVMLPWVLTNGSLQTAASTHPATLPLTEVKWKCAPPMFGSGVQRHSCIQALSTMDFETRTQKTWGQRGLPYDYPMPQRWVSRMPLYNLANLLFRFADGGVEDGKCIIEPILKPTRSFAYASQREIVLGAKLVIENCFDEEKPSSGGGAANIGETDTYRSLSMAADP